MPDCYGFKGMTIKNGDRRKLRLEMLVTDDRWKKKGGPHKLRAYNPQVCRACMGSGLDGDHHFCPICQGTGEVDGKKI